MVTTKVKIVVTIRVTIRVTILVTIRVTILVTIRVTIRVTILVTLHVTSAVKNMSTPTFLCDSEFAALLFAVLTKATVIHALRPAHAWPVNGQHLRDARVS
jgi:hypothetical protein